MNSARFSSRRWRRFAGLCAWWLAVLLAGVVLPVYAWSSSWLVDRAGDNPADGDLASRRGSLRFVLAHVADGEDVQFGDIGADTIYLDPQNGPLVVPANVAVGGRRSQADCGSYTAPQVTIADPVLAPAQAMPTLMVLNAHATLRHIALLRGLVSVRIAGTDVEVCGVGLGRSVDGDGMPLNQPPWHAALVIDGDHAIIRRNYIAQAVSVTPAGSDTRLGDAPGGSGDENAGVRNASVTVGADATGAAQRVSIRDPFPRGLAGFVPPGAFGGDDDPTHANNWAATPTIGSAQSADGLSVAVSGTANPLSLVDIFFDNQLTVARAGSATADATGNYTFTSTLPSGTVTVYAASTLADAAHPNRVGSSSAWAGPRAVIVSGAEPQLAATASATNLSGDPGGPASPGDIIRFTVTMTNTGPVNIISIHSAPLPFDTPRNTLILLGSGTAQGQGSGFVATDGGFTGGALAPGQVETYTVDALVGSVASASMTLFTVEVGGDGTIAVPVVARMRLQPGSALELLPRAWVPLVDS